MKTFLSVIVGAFVFAAMIFYVDVALVNWLVDLFPPSAAEWMGLIKVALWVAILCLTGGFSIFLAVLAGVLARMILGN